MTELEYMICESERCGEIDLDTRDELLGILYESTSLQRNQQKMDKDHTNIIGTVVGNHNVTISDRKTLMITGVKKIDSFDNEEFLMETVMGFLVLKGDDLELLKLDTFH